MDIEGLVNAKNFLSDKRIVIFGAGTVGEEVLKWFENFSSNIVFADNNTSNWGEKHGREVLNPELLNGKSDKNIVLIASMYVKEIAEQLNKYGFNENQNYFNCYPIYQRQLEKKVSETSKVRASLAEYCTGDGIDIGYGGDPIVNHAICMDLPSKYASYLDKPQHLHGSAEQLVWFKDNTLDFVYSSHVLEDFVDTKSVLEEWLRVLKVGGKLILFLPDESLYRAYCLEQGKLPNTHHIHENFSLRYVLDILEQINQTKVIYKSSPSNIYSFELVLEKMA